MMLDKLVAREVYLDSIAPGRELAAIVTCL